MNEKKKLYQKLIKSFKQISGLFWKHTPPPQKKTTYSEWNDQNLKKKNPQNFNT